MSIDKLRFEATEYHLRIEEVLSGMDRVLTELSNRLGKVETEVVDLRRQRLGAPPTLAARVSELDEQVATLAAVVHDLLETPAR